MPSCTQSLLSVPGHFSWYTGMPCYTESILWVHEGTQIMSLFCGMGAGSHIRAAPIKGVTDCIANVWGIKKTLGNILYYALQYKSHLN